MLLYTDQMAITTPLGHLPIARPTCAAEPAADSLDPVWVRTGRQIPSNIWAPDSTVTQLSAAVVAAVQP